MGDQFCDRKNCPDAIYPWPFWREPIGRAQKNPPTPPFLFFCSIWAIGLSSAQIRSLCKLSQLVPKPSSVAPVWTAVFTPGATVMEMIGGSASQPIVCRESTGPITSERPFALPAIVASACAIFAGASSGPSLLPIATQIAMLQLAGLFPPEAMISQSFYLAEDGAQPFQGRTTAAPKYVDLTAEDDPRGYDDMFFWEATQRAGGLAAPDPGRSRHPKAKPPPTPAQIAAYNSNNVGARRAGYPAGSGRFKAKVAPDAAFRAAERELVALLGAAPLDDDPIEEPSPSVRDEIEDFS